MALGVALACMAITPGHATAQQKHGDVNGDGAVTALDAQAILSFTVGLTLPPGFVIANGNANCDVKADGTDNVGALDAQIVLSYVIGLNVSQYCVGQAFGSASVAVDISPKDSSLLINRGMVMKATVKDNNGFLIKRPIAWSSSNPAIVSIDSVKGDSLAFVKASANPGSSTITATSDGASFFTQLKVFLSYAGIVITPQRADTIRHHVHKDGDPRTPRLFEIAREEDLEGPHLKLFAAIGRVHPQVLGKTLPLNGAGVCGAALADLRLPMELLRGFALLARTAGLIGQLAEELRNPVANEIFLSVDLNNVSIPPGESHG